MDLLFIAIVFAFFNGIDSATVTFKNNCQEPVWPATLNNYNSPPLSKTGFYLAPGGGTDVVNVPPSFSGLFWGRTQCNTNSGSFRCSFGDCASGQVACNGKGGISPLTQIEFTFGGSGQDTYDISLVNGYNIAVGVAPQGGTGVRCNAVSCKGMKSVCPAELAVKGPNNNVLACKSACDEFKQPQYCCTESYEPRGACKPTNYSMIFKNQCPSAYSYAHDDQSSTFTCNTGINYVVTFCP
ncbi:Pathogenesis-related thaumatin superfamily protein [Euphorbia peplus]|nr:Pathogenesis-related thaumatin superfamily protein [Euphorbia peplus]